MLALYLKIYYISVHVIYIYTHILLVLPDKISITLGSFSWMRYCKFAPLLSSVRYLTSHNMRQPTELSRRQWQGADKLKVLADAP